MVLLHSLTHSLTLSLNQTFYQSQSILNPQQTFWKLSHLVSLWSDKHLTRARYIIRLHPLKTSFKWWKSTEFCSLFILSYALSTVSDEPPLTEICLQSKTHSDFVATKSNITFTTKTRLFVMYSLLKTKFFFFSWDVLIKTRYKQRPTWFWTGQYLRTWPGNILLHEQATFKKAAWRVCILLQCWIINFKEIINFCKY